MTTLFHHLRIAWHNAYYRVTMAYIAIVLTLIFLAIILNWGR